MTPSLVRLPGITRSPPHEKGPVRPEEVRDDPRWNAGRRVGLHAVAGNEEAWATLDETRRGRRSGYADRAAVQAVPPAVDRDGAQTAVADLLVALGQDLDSPHLAETPRRAADALIELLTPEPFRATTFPNDEGYDGLVVVAGIPFHSLCACTT